MKKIFSLALMLLLVLSFSSTTLASDGQPISSAEVSINSDRASEDPAVNKMRAEAENYDDMVISDNTAFYTSSAYYDPEKWEHIFSETTTQWSGRLSALRDCKGIPFDSTGR